MQTAMSKIWTRITIITISYNNNYYTTSALLRFIIIHINIYALNLFPNIRHQKGQVSDHLVREQVH